MRAILEDAVGRLPAPFGHLAMSIEGWRVERRRYGKRYRAIFRQVDRRGIWTTDQVVAWRDERLRAFLGHAFTTVPHYRNLARREGIDIREIRTLSDLRRIPILTKDQVQADPASFLSETVHPSDQVVVHTSGTTGAGLRFASTREALAEQWAVWWRYREQHGIRHGTWCGYFGGRRLMAPERPKGPYWRYDLSGKRVLFSAYHLDPQSAQDYVKELRRRQPPWLHGYPSVLALLASYIIEDDLPLGYTPRWITTGAENLSRSQEATIRDAFGSAPLQHYGLTEAVANASQCAAGRLHVDEDHCAVEFAPSQSDGLEIIGTNLSNRATPLIRYATGDLASESLDSCDCGRPGRVISEIDGRDEDQLVLEDGRRLGRLDHLLKDMTQIREAQFLQFRRGEATLRVVRRAGFTEVDERRLREELNRYIGRGAAITIEFVDLLPRSERGKLRLVESHLRQ